MVVVDNALDDVQMLNRIVTTIQPSLSRVGCSIDKSDAFLRRAGISQNVQSVGKKERERLLQLQRESQKAWDVAAEFRLVLPELRTMAPSCTKAAADVNNDLGGTIIEGAGYNTIVDMVPTAETIKHIADNDELISSFRPYRIDALRTARMAQKTTENAPHPDDARQLETTLFMLPANRLIDADAVSDAVGREHWTTASEFNAAILPEAQLSATANGMGATTLSGRAKSPRETGRSVSPSFKRAKRFHDGSSLPGVWHPELGHYHLRFSQVEPRVTGGYIAPPRTRTVKEEEQPEELSLSRPKTVFDCQTPSIHGAESVRDFAVSVTYRVSEPAFVVRERLAPANTGSYFFTSKTPRSVASARSAAADLDYFPYADVRSTVKRVRCPAKFAFTVTERKREAVAAAAAVGMYDVGGDIAHNPHRIVAMDRESTREKHWLNKVPPYRAVPDVADVDNALNAVRRRTRNVLMAPRLSTEEQLEKQQRMKNVDRSVSIERDTSFPRGMFDRCDAPRVRQFSRMKGRSSFAPTSVAPEAPENVNLAPVTKRSVAVYINPKAPGHTPLHQPNPAEIGEVPNYKWVKPTTERAAKINGSSRPPATWQVMHDLCYDTSNRRLVEPRVVGNPMIETHVSREKRARLFNTGGCGAQAVYNVDIPYKCKSVPLFERQITKETQFCGHRLQSERWERKNPRAPGPGHYNVSYNMTSR